MTIFAIPTVVLRRSVFIILVLSVLSATAFAATHTVTKTADTNDGVCDADCSLREAVIAANSSPTSDVIEFSSSVFGVPRTIEMDRVSVGTVLKVVNAGALTILGPGADMLTIDGMDTFRIFFADERASLTLTGMRLRRGVGHPFQDGGFEGAAIANRGTLTLNGVSITDSGRPGQNGGAIYNSGTLTILNSSLANNRTVSIPTSAGRGGAIFNDSGSIVRITDSFITNNSSADSDDRAEGGAIYNAASVDMTITNSVLSGNTGAEGGAIYATGGDLRIVNSTVANNISVRNSIGGGGGIFHGGGVLTITGSTFSGNSAQGPGGAARIAAESGTISNSTFSGNSVSDGTGGAIANSGTLSIANTTITGNSASAINNFDGGRGGGIINSGNLTLQNTTINNNVASRSGGGVSTSQPITSASSIYADNIALSGALDFAGTMTSLGYNLVESAAGTTFTGTVTGNITGREAYLAPLGNYGGPTQTVALLPTSPAIDAGDPLSGISTDQRGIARPQDGNLDGAVRSDIGAYERQVNRFVVTKTADTNDGTCSSDCSLREALMAANGSSAADDAIVFDTNAFGSSQGVVLTGGELRLTKSNGTLLIAGTSRDRLTISGNSLSRVFAVQAGSIAVISKLTMTEGRADSADGGAMANSGVTVLDDVAVRDNSATYGGGVGNRSEGTLSIQNSTIENNNATEFGGGLFNDRAARLNIATSTIAGNSSRFNGGGISNVGFLSVDLSTIRGNRSRGGGGLYNDSPGASAIIHRSTVQTNQAENGGGGLSNSNAVLSVIGTTLVGNSAGFDGSGGAILNIGSGEQNSLGLLNIVNSTVFGNDARAGGGIATSFRGTSNIASSTISSNVARSGGGLSSGPDGTVQLRNSIVGDNHAETGPDLIGSFTSQGNNLIEQPAPGTITGPGNITGRDPLLSRLADNGGPTQTQALLAGSPAIDNADANQFPATDQRGYPRPEAGDGIGTARADIGAYELRTKSVTTTNDSGPGSLRQALQDAAGSADAVVFNRNSFPIPRTINLTGGELVVPANVTLSINGPGADNLTISGNNTSRVFFISESAKVTIDGVTVAGGNGSGGGETGNDGGISNWGTLTLSKSVVRGNTANGNGGGIGGNLNSSLVLLNTAVRDNSATGAGGGVFLQNATGSLVKSTVSNNTAGGTGGGVSILSGNLFTRDSTVSNNTAANGGGGIYSSGAAASFTLLHSTVAENSTTNGAGGGVNNLGGAASFAGTTIFANNRGTSPDFAGQLHSLGYNLIEDVSGTTIVDEFPGNIVGQDPQLLPLRNNGGPTQTHALRLTSPAIDQGRTTGPVAVFTRTDQRGLPTYDFPSVSNVAGGSGIDIGAFERQPNDVSGVIFDYDGDGKTDISIFRPSNGDWYLQRSRDGLTGMRFGLGTDKIVPADYDGDGKTDVAVYRPSEKTWFIVKSSDGSLVYHVFGLEDDIPMPGDFDGDGKADVSVFRPSDSTWYRLNSRDGSFFGRQFGASGDKPVMGDFDGDGKADLAVFRPTNGVWYYIRSSDDAFYGEQFGSEDDSLVPADYDGDGKTDLAVYRPSNGFWYIKRSLTSDFAPFQFGQTGDIPTPGDYDGDGKADISVFRPLDGQWYRTNSGNGSFFAFPFGINGDRPTPSAFQ